MKKSTKKLRDFSKMLLEDGAPINPTDPQPLPLETQNLSLDMKVDNYFMKYEKESLPTQQTYAVPGTDLGASAPSMMEFKKVALRLLREAEGDDPAADAGADPAMGGGDAGADAGGGEEAPAGGGAPAAPAVENPRFNVRNFAQSVARLVLNYEGLLDPRTTILNRARAYVEKNYDAGLARQMMEILESQFQLSPREPQANNGVVAPPAGGAWTGVGGGGGG
jgi:hypothetical protein